MNKKTTSEPEKPHVLKAQGAAQELIGKLVGDDAQVDQGRAKQKKAGSASEPTQSTQSTTKE